MSMHCITPKNPRAVAYSWATESFSPLPARTQPNSNSQAHSPTYTYYRYAPDRRNVNALIQNSIHTDTPTCRHADTQTHTQLDINKAHSTSRITLIPGACLIHLLFIRRNVP